MLNFIEDHTLYGWGSDVDLELGINEKTVNEPTQVCMLGDAKIVKAVAANQWSVVLIED
jgi:alpha-tubulin suppressor-like RCC1 family protein